ncbi:MAG: hypothetical protein CMJ87_11610 [Planctomycetes bacterium]|nr:hypothetical protein [Planctomycetota bacterium]
MAMDQARDRRPTVPPMTSLQAGVATLICLCLAAACASSGGAGQGARGQKTADSGAGVVSLTDLPETHRDLWNAYLAAGNSSQDRAAWERARSEALEDPRLCAFLVDNLLRQLVRAWDRSQLAATGHLPGPFERARRELARLGPLAVPTLVELMAMADGSVALLAADVLAEIGAPALGPTAALLEREAAAARRRGAELLGRLPRGEAAPRRGTGAAEASAESCSEVALVAALGRRLLQDTEWVVRAQAARALGLRGGNGGQTGAARSVLGRGLRDEETNVRRESARALAALRDPRSIPILIDALERSVIDGQVGELPSLRAALKSLSGGRDYTSMAQWRQWWSTSGAECVRNAGY